MKTSQKPQMKTLKTILREAREAKVADVYEYYADAERRGEISLNTYFRACDAVDLSRDKAIDCLRENYQRAGLGHLSPV